MRWGVVAGGAAFVVAAVLGIRIASNRGASSGVDIALSHLPPGYAATHGKIAFNPVTGTAHMDNFVLTRNGAPVLTAGMLDVTGIGSLVGGIPARVGHITLTDVTANGAGPVAVRHLDRIEAEGLETATLSKLLDQGAYPGGKPAWTDRRPVLERLDTYGVVLHVEPDPKQHNGPFDVTIKHEHLTGVSARQFAVAPTPDAMHRPEFAADVLRALAWREEGGEELRADLPNAGLLRMGKDGNTDYDGGRIGSYVAQAISFVSSKRHGELDLGRISFNGIDATHLLDQLADPAGTAAPDMTNPLRVTGFSLRDLKANFEHAPLVTLASIDSSNESAQGDFSSGTLTLRNLDIVTTGRDLPAQSQQALQSFGMQDFSVNMDVDASFDRATGHMIAKRDDIVFKGLGTLHATFDIDGLKAGAQPTPGEPMPAFHTARLIHADLRWDDASLTSRLFHMAAIRSGQSEDALRATLALPLASAVAFFPDQPDVADQLNAFLDGRHTLSATLAPATPVSFADVTTAAPTEKAHVLGVTIKGN